jgi:hypothetical protein
LLRAHEQAGGFLRENPAAGDPGATVDESLTEGPGTQIGPYNQAKNEQELRRFRMRAEELLKRE